MVAILYNFNLDYFICNINDSYWNFINIASNLSDVINANVAQIYIGPINQNKKKSPKDAFFLLPMIDILMKYERMCTFVDM